MAFRAGPSMLALLAWAFSLQAAAQEPPEIRPSVNGRAVYRVATAPDGTRYIDSEIYRADDRPRLERHALDKAISETPAAVVHGPTGLSFPKRLDGCVLTSLSGLYTPLGFTFATGGLGIFRCEPASGVSVVLFSFEADAKMGLRGEALGRRLIAGAMTDVRDPRALACEAAKSGDRLELRCARKAVLDGAAIEERGVVLMRGGDTFLKVVYPCLEADCARAEAQVRRVVDAAIAQAGLAD